jgi:hypothetical protein
MREIKTQVYCVLFPTGSEYATVEAVDADVVRERDIALGVRYFSPPHDAFFIVCDERETADKLAWSHKLGWN